MYALFAYIGGEWGFAGIDPHEECAVMFIEAIDSQFGDGTAQVFKLPNKSEHTPTGDAAEHHATMASMQDMLKALETNTVDIDTEFRSFNKWGGRN